MAAEILTQTSDSFAELSAVYSEKGVAEAQARLQVVLEFKSLKPKSVQFNGRRVPSPALQELAQKAGVSLGTLWRWYRLYRSAFELDALGFADPMCVLREPRGCGKLLGQ